MIPPAAYDGVNLQVQPADDAEHIIQCQAWAMWYAENPPRSRVALWHREVIKARLSGRPAPWPPSA